MRAVISRNTIFCAMNDFGNMNGTVTRVRSAKDIMPGCTIVVPSKARKRGMSIAEMLSIGSMTATLGTVIAAFTK